MFKFARKLGRDTSGATAVEYGLILALVFLTMVGAVQAFGSNTISMWNTVSDNVNGSTGG